MGRGELERLSKEELIELVLRLQRPEKTSCTSSKPPSTDRKEELIELVLRLQRPEKPSRTSSKPASTDRKEQRERAKPGGAKPGHEGHGRVISETADEVVEHRPDQCSWCGAALPADLP